MEYGNDKLFDMHMASAYRHCIKHQMNLPEEVIEWFYGKVDEVTAMDDASAVLSTTRRWKLSYSPTRWASIVKMEADAAAAPETSVEDLRRG